MEEIVRLETNDPIHPVIEVTVTGFVEKFAEIHPERVRLIGSPGEAIFADVVIAPREEYPFRIHKVGARNGEFIIYKWVETCHSDENRCVIRVENTKEQKGRYLDALLIETTSTIRPVIPIYVFGLIR